MKKFLFFFLAIMPLLFTNCKKSTDTYLFHFCTSYKCTGLDASENAVQEIQSGINFSKYYEYTTTRDEAIASAQAEFDNAISQITKDYTDCFENGEYVTISMEMFAPDNYVVDSKLWGLKE